MHIVNFILCCLGVIGMSAGAQSPSASTAPAPAGHEPMALWPKGAPGPSLTTGPEHDTATPKSDKVDGRPVARLANVGNPTIAIYRPAKDKDTGTAVIVCPGGAYKILAFDLEGTEICEWLNSMGVTGVLLKYRVPAGDLSAPGFGPLQDAQRALSVTRAHAAQWGINPARIGIMGFSAGAHLSAAASTGFEKRAYAAVDDADKLSCRPDFTLLIYPWRLIVEHQGDKISPELPVTAQTPPTFLVQTEDDPVRVENSIFYYLALKQAKVKSEMHLFPVGGHGYGLRPSKNAVAAWPQLAQEWLRAQGMLNK